MVIDLQKLLKEHKKLKKALKKAKKKKKSKRFIAKPKAKLIKKLDPIKTLTKGEYRAKLVREGETGFFKKEYIQEKQNFLGGYSL